MRTPPREDQLEALFAAAEYFDERGELQGAFRCLLDGARGGHASCQINLGNYYSDGTGVRRDHAKAAHWYRKAYTQGRSHNLAIDYRNAGNLRAAMAWFRKAIARGDGSSAVELAKLLFARGDRAEAVRLLHRVHDGDLCEVLQMRLPGWQRVSAERPRFWEGHEPCYNLFWRRLRLVALLPQSP
jgi:tetratricopeptide (TPR) repeat protein